MAARRFTRQLDEKWRASIQTSMLLRRLQDSGLGKIELTPTQLKSIEILLRKAIPDLSNITISGDAENPLNISIIERHVVKAR